MTTFDNQPAQLRAVAEGLADEAAAFVDEQRRIYEEDVDILRLASELVIDAIVEPQHLRAEIIGRFERSRGKDRSFSDRRHGVPPV